MDPAVIDITTQRSTPLVVPRFSGIRPDALSVSLDAGTIDFKTPNTQD